MARANGFNAKAVDQFFTNLVTLLEKFSFGPGRIVSLDETGITNVAVCPKVLAPTGRKQIGQITAAERGTLVTAVGCIANDGNTIPPVLLFPRLRVPVDRLGRGAPPGTLTLNSATGWMTAEIFATDVLPHVVRHTKARQDNPILLLLDNHASHVSLEAVRFCQANGIHLLTFPPHCSHRLQPLDVAVYGPMKSAYKRALHDHQMTNPGRRIDLYQMADIFRRAYDCSFTRKNILNGFAASGVSPLNRDVFDEADFAPAAVSVPVLVPSAGQPAVAEPEPPAAAVAVPVPAPEPDGPAEASLRSPESIRPLPRLQVSERKAGRKKGQSRVMTSTPERAVLEESHLARTEKNKRKRVLQSGEGPSKTSKRTASKLK
ncbi:MFS-type transporter clz9-like [Amphibalanus amphitrite]|uniref:MFS-type transporter clz9-like n=1 Tax=Amphibalanus amphitrite TaxID=1232801 RepID=UPI001C910EAA|nr:MFS-type transporter clz9-like [Amphibalanus amphitrite]